MCDSESRYRQKSANLLAIDPGASGGLALYNADEDKLSLAPFPKARTDFMNVVGELALGRTPIFAYVEEVPKFIVGDKASASAIATLHQNFGYILGVLDAYGFPTHLVKPQVWQEATDAGSKKAYGTRWKAHLKDLAARTFPQCAKALTLKTADAALILAYALLKNHFAWAEMPFLAFDKTGFWLKPQD